MMCALISSRPSSKTWNRPTGPAPTITASVSIGAGACDESTSASQLGQLVLAVLPLVGVRRRRLALGDARPLLGQLGVELDEVLLIAGHVFLGEDGVTGHSGMQTAQSMHSSGSMVR